MIKIIIFPYLDHFHKKFSIIGEELELIDDSQGDWWFARSVRNKCEGYIPSNYVEKTSVFNAQ